MRESHRSDSPSPSPSPSARRLARAGFLLAYLPYNRALYSAGGWNLSGGPFADDWKHFLREYFPERILANAWSAARSALNDWTRASRGDRLLTIWEADYPEILTRIFDPPPVLFVRGPLPGPGATLIAIVGTRSPQLFTGDVTEAFVRTLLPGTENAPAPVIVSGFARGVDRQAHLAAIRVGLPNIAVLGTGLDNLSPASNRDLPRLARERGLPFTLLSEFPPGTPGYPAHFPRRNRIIAGLVRTVVIVQAPFKSGAMITARFALEEGRDLLVFDHALFDERSNGGNRSLLEAGAELLRVPDWERGLLREPAFPNGPNPGANPDQLEFWRRRAGGRLRRVGPGVYWERSE